MSPHIKFQWQLFAGTTQRSKGIQEASSIIFVAPSEKCEKSVGLEEKLPRYDDFINFGSFQGSCKLSACNVLIARDQCLLVTLLSVSTHTPFVSLPPFLDEQ